MRNFTNTRIKICVYRHSGNYEVVNQLFSKLYDKRYSGTGRSKNSSNDYMYFPPLSFGNLKGKIQANFKVKTYKQVSISEFIKIIKETENIDLL